MNYHSPHPNRHTAAAALLQVEISLQPWHAFKPDGVILFSDILTPLPGMNIPFDMAPGPIIMDPIRTMAVSALRGGGDSGSKTQKRGVAHGGRRGKAAAIVGLGDGADGDGVVGEVDRG